MRWIACPLVVMVLLLFSSASAPSDIPSVATSPPSISSVDGLEELLRFLQEEQSVPESDFSNSQSHRQPQDDLLRFLQGAQSVIDIDSFDWTSQGSRAYRIHLQTRSW